MQTTILLQGKEAQMWTMLQALDALGVFDVKYGAVTINFDGDGKISNVKIEKNYRTIPTTEVINLQSK